MTDFFEHNKHRLIKTAVAVLLMLVSLFHLAKISTSTDYHADTIQSLDEKKTTVMELAAASTAASAAITLIPGDTATPIADKLADLGSSFLIVLCAIYLEKYLVTITGYAAFYFLVPVGCLLYILHLWAKSEFRRQLAIRLVVLGFAIALIIPTSVKVSDMIQDTYDESIEATIETAKETTEALEESTSGKSGSFISSITQSVSDAAQNLEQVLNNFMEALAVMLVTSCVIPVIVLLFFVWLIKLIFGINIPAPRRDIIPILPASESKK